MEQRRWRAPGADMPLDLAKVAGLTGAIGTSGYVEALMGFAHATCRVDFVSVFCQGDRDTPLLVGTACRLGQRRAELAARGHERHVEKDGNTAILLGQKGKGAFLTAQDADEIQPFTYRRDCYDLPGISGRISLVSRKAAYGLSVSLYSSRESGRFDPAARDSAEAVLGLLLAATERHVAFSLKGCVWMEQDVQTRLALNYPDLTTREREVAAMAIKGRTALETAEVLGLAETTVITHRKKAYKRMNVTSLRQLVAKL